MPKKPYCVFWDEYYSDLKTNKIKKGDLAANGLDAQLEINENNFETLPTAFNTHTLKIENGGELRRFATSSDFTGRVSLFTNKIMDKTKVISGDEAFSEMSKWIEFSEIIFSTINAYPDLYFFNDILQKSQERKLQEHLNAIIRDKLSVKDALFAEIDSTITVLEDAESKIRTTLDLIKQALLNDLEDYVRRVSVNDSIKKIKKEFLEFQIEQMKNLWLQTLRIKMREKRMSLMVRSGDGIINDHINSLLRSGKLYTQDEAQAEFERLFDERTLEITKHIDETINSSETYTNHIYTIYSTLERNLPSRKEIYR